MERRKLTKVQYYEKYYFEILDGLKIKVKERSNFEEIFFNDIVYNTALRDFIKPVLGDMTGSDITITNDIYLTLPQSLRTKEDCILKAEILMIVINHN